MSTCSGRSSRGVGVLVLSPFAPEPRRPRPVGRADGAGPRRARRDVGGARRSSAERTAAHRARPRVRGLCAAPRPRPARRSRFRSCGAPRSRSRSRRGSSRRSSATRQGSRRPSADGASLSRASAECAAALAARGRLARAGQQPGGGDGGAGLRRAGATRTPAAALARDRPGSRSRASSSSSPIRGAVALSSYGRAADLRLPRGGRRGSPGRLAARRAGRDRGRARTVGRREVDAPPGTRGPRAALPRGALRRPGRGRRRRHAQGAPGRPGRNGRDGVPGSGGPGRHDARRGTRSRSGSRTSGRRRLRSRRGSRRPSQPSTRSISPGDGRTSSRAASCSASASRRRSRCGRGSAPRRADVAARRRRRRGVPVGRRVGSARGRALRASRRAGARLAERVLFVEGGRSCSMRSGTVLRVARARAPRVPPGHVAATFARTSCRYAVVALDDGSLPYAASLSSAASRSRSAAARSSRSKGRTESGRRRSPRSQPGCSSPPRARVTARACGIPVAGPGSLPRPRARLDEVALGVGGDQERARARSRRSGSLGRRAPPARPLERRAGAARARSGRGGEPDLLVLDEPTRGVDPERKAELAALAPRARQPPDGASSSRRTTRGSRRTGASRSTAEEVRVAA